MIAGLQQANEEAFADFVVRHCAAMRRVATAVTRNAAIAEEAVQETWLAVLKGIHRFEARSSLRTWVFRILVNRARSIAERERRVVPFSSLQVRPDASAAPGERRSTERFGAGWVEPLADGGLDPESAYLSAETREIIERAVAGLAPSQRAVITLRDLEGFEPEDVCGILGISDGHQRVLLHRARAAVRRALLRYDGGGRAAGEA